MHISRLLVVSALVLAACGGSTTETPQPGGPGGDTPLDRALGGPGDDVCDAAREMALAMAMGTDDVEDIIRPMEAIRRSAPPDVADDISTVLDAWRAAAEGDANALTENEVWEADERVSDYLARECPGLFEVDAEDPLPEDDNRGTFTVTVAGETFTEQLSGYPGVECRQEGLLEDGEIAVILRGARLRVATGIFNQGVAPGTFQGWVRVMPPPSDESSDASLDEEPYAFFGDNGTFVLAEAYEVEPGDEDTGQRPLWFFAGSFSLTAPEESPDASVEGTFECVTEVYP